MAADTPFIHLEDVWYYDGPHARVAGISATIRDGDTVVLIGPNGSGKTLVTQIAAGRRRSHRGRVEYGGIDDPRRRIYLVSFEEQAQIVAGQRRTDLSWLMHGETDQGQKVLDFIRGAGEPSQTAVESAISRYGLGAIRDQGLRFLSSGEWRRTILARAVVHEPVVTVFDDPYDGLDREARTALRTVLDAPPPGGTARIVAVGRDRDIPLSATHVVALDAGTAIFAGPAAAYRRTAEPPAPAPRIAPEAARSLVIPTGEPGANRNDPNPPRELVRMEGVNVAYEGRPIITDVTWRVRSGETWQIEGPNGAGKSTLLSLVDGSNTKAYGQAIRLFGRRRGTGESVEDIRAKIGVVSPALHALFPLRSTATETIVSGFHDSAGLYERPSGLELEIARRWLELLGLDHHARTRLRDLSFGDQRALLIARAMVKEPPLLIADEPAHGLDDRRSAFVLDVIGAIASQSETAILYVSHDPRQRLAEATHRLIVTPGAEGSRVSGGADGAAT